MAFPWIPTPYGPEGRQTAWLNTCFNAHSIFCGCDSAFVHFVQACTQNKLVNLSEKEIKEAQCQIDLSSGKENLTTTDVLGDHDTENFGEGDLIKLFEEPFEQEDNEG